MAGAMRRADRLFQIIQVLRRARAPVTADAIAAELETSKRTIYRDIADLIGQRAPIRGEAGVGYVLEDGFDMPPLMLTPEEGEAAVLGAPFVVHRGDPAGEDPRRGAGAAAAAERRAGDARRPRLERRPRPARHGERAPGDPR